MHKIIASSALYTKSALNHLRMRFVFFCGDLTEQTHTGSHPSSLCWTGHCVVWSSTLGICAVTSAEAAQLPSVSHSSQIPITAAPCLREGLLTPSPAVTLLVLSSSLLSRTLKEILNSPGGRTSGTRLSQLEKWSPDNYPWLWYFNLCTLCTLTLLAALGACNLDFF